MDAMTAQEAQADLERLIGQVVEDVDPLILCNSQGQRAVLMSLDEFSAWQETVYLLSNPSQAQRLLGSIQDARAGKVFEKDLIEE